jgi:glutamate-1-semialdehyde aminotransferase
MNVPDETSKSNATRPQDGKGQRLYERAKGIVPGGTQLLSKRPEMFLPEQWPAYYSRASGAEIWDLDNRHYYDFTHGGVGSCLLGYADPDVNAAVKNAVDQGSMTTLNAPEEVELAEVLCELHPWADMVRYARGGGEATAIAIRLARAATGRNKVAFCGYHGWTDWYLAANLAESSALDGHLLPGLSPHGVPRGLQGTALPFRYNDAERLRAIVEEHSTDLAAIIMEPIRSDAPLPDFLPEVRRLATASGAVLIIDEITAGFRLNAGGAHLLFNLVPDIAVFAKGMSNGYPMAAIIGRSKIMSCAQDSFISSTYWTERLGPVAALATIQKHRRLNLPKILAETGQALRQVWVSAAEQAGLEIKISGIAPMPAFSFAHPAQLTMKSYFTQLMLDAGYLAGSSVYATYAHKPELVEQYGRQVHAAFAEVGRALAQGETILREKVRGPLAHTGFSRLT